MPLAGPLALGWTALDPMRPSESLPPFGRAPGPAAVPYNLS